MSERSQMPVMALIDAGQNGNLIRTLGAAAGTDESVARAAVERLCRTIARRISERASDPLERELLLDVIAGGGFERYLDDPRAMLSRDAVGDGEELLAHLYGSLELARDEARVTGPPAGLDPDVFARMMTLAAGLLLAALSRRHSNMTRSAVAARPGAGGVLDSLVRAVVRGFIEGATRSLRPRRRAGALTRRGGSRRRRAAIGTADDAPSIDELLGDLVDDQAARR